MDTTKDQYDIKDLKQLMARLRDRDNGCPWDCQQTFETIAPYTVEEAYEVADAVERQNMPDLKDELGDLLFQILFHSQMASENGDFTFDDVVDHVTKKMVFRHPHVFGDEKAASTKDIEERIWQEQKDKEKANKENKNVHYLDDVTMALPSLLLAHKAQKRVRKVGFKYNELSQVIDKVNEEIQELNEAYTTGVQQDIEEEYGDVLLVATLMSHHLGVNPENALRKACLKFISRFNALEDLLKDNGQSLDQSSIQDMERAWTKVKEVDNQKP